MGGEGTYRLVLGLLHQLGEQLPHFCERGGGGWVIEEEESMNR